MMEIEPGTAEKNVSFLTSSCQAAASVMAVAITAARSASRSTQRRRPAARYRRDGAGSHRLPLLPFRHGGGARLPRRGGAPHPPLYPLR